MDETQWPEHRRFGRNELPPTGFVVQLEALRGECARVANELQIAAPTLAPRAALEAIVKGRPRTVDEIMESAGLLRWQAELLEGAVEICLYSDQEENSLSRRENL